MKLVKLALVKNKINVRAAIINKLLIMDNANARKNFSTEMVNAYNAILNKNVRFVQVK